MDNVVNIRDFKRKEEQAADLVRLAREVMGLGVPGVSLFGSEDTAPSEMPPYQAPESDPA